MTADDRDGRAKTQEFRDRLSKGESFDDIIEEAFAVVREAAWRVLELRHYDVQVDFERRAPRDARCLRSTTVLISCFFFKRKLT